MFRTIVLSFLLLYGYTLPAHADQLFLINGDRLTGTLENLSDGKLTFTSKLAGVITVDIRNVQTLTTDTPVTLRLQDGSTVKAQVSAAAAGHLMLSHGAVLQSQTVSLADVTAINPPRPKWKGNLRAGYTITRGNSETENANAGFELQRRTEKDRATAEGAYLFSREKDKDTGDRNTGS